MSRPAYIPKGFVMIYTQTHSICMRVDHIVQVSKGGIGSMLQIATSDGEIYKADYDLENFLSLMSEALEE